MGKIEQTNDSAPTEKITNLADLKAKVEGIKSQELLSPEDERTAVLAHTLGELADINNDVRGDNDPNALPSNPPTYELLS